MFAKIVSVDMVKSNVFYYLSTSSRCVHSQYGFVHLHPLNIHATLNDIDKTGSTHFEPL
jgi:hypothetical protein